MRNKAWISQAFSGQPKLRNLELRRADVFDVFDLSRVLIRSITDLCGADHQDRPQTIALWTANKDPATIRGWIVEGAPIWLAERAGQIGCRHWGAIGRTDQSPLLYMSIPITPDAASVAPC